MPNTIPSEQLPEIAARRGWQTLRDSLIAAAVIVGLPVIITAVQSASSWAEFLAGLGALSWWLFQAVLVACLTAVIAWVQRRFRDHDGVEPWRAAVDDE